jgi:hypothetical protein
MEASPAENVTEAERPRDDALDRAAEAFRQALSQGRAEPDDEAADEPEAEGEEILRSAGGGDRDGIDADAEPEGEEGKDGDGGGEVADAEADAKEEAAAPLPASWPDERLELWRSLPAEAQAFIAARESQRDAALNARFQEAAQLRKANEAELAAARTARERYADAVDQVLGLVVPQPPPRSMLDAGSPDYDPDAYHYRKALNEDVVAFLGRHAAQRQQIAAQAQSERFDAINDATRDAFLRSVPDAADQARAPAVFQELIDYAVALGTPPHVFSSPTTALEWHVLWKAREHDRLQQARARVRETPPPEPKKPQPALRPGVPARRGAIEQQKRASAMERLAREGSVDAGAAALKHLLKGNLS